MLTIPLQIPDAVTKALAQTYERHGRWLPTLATALFVVLAARAAADLVWTLTPTPQSAAWQAPRPVVSNLAKRQAGTVDIDAVVTAELFGRYQPPAVTGDALLAAPETPLNLTLIGLLAGTSEKDSRALIASQNGEEKAYAVGDDVVRGVTLQAIFPDRVILSRDGRLETLRLERDRLDSSSGLVPAPQVPAGDAAPSGTVSLQQLSQIREEILRDPAKAAQYLRLQPNNSGGQLHGYRIYPGSDRNLFNAAGLRPGDLITAVNGVQLDDPAKALQLLGQLGTTEQLNLVVERGGQTQTVNISLD